MFSNFIQNYQISLKLNFLNEELVGFKGDQSALGYCLVLPHLAEKYSS